MMINEHKCNSLPNSGVYLHFDDEVPAWTLNIQKEATESDLEENHHLENIGDIIWLTSLNILFCPYCGEQLPGLVSIDKSNYGYFQHNNFSRW
ncbi:MAG: hypothetical protein HOB14_12380 [Gammaproteobacteria bacterium]|jgi:hypothetical protein|nr:hypothetical protein [Gammaproteobacteria bacterium]